jgi:hypothetical protein
MPDIPVAENQANLRSKLFRWSFKLLVSAALLVFVFREVSLTVFLNALRSLQAGYLCLAILTFFPAQLLAAYRWWYLLDQMGCNQPYWRVVRLSLLGQFSALFLPGQISGDVVRTFGMARGVKFVERVALSVVFDKLAFMAAIATFALMGWFLNSPLSPYVGVHLFSLGLFISALGGMVVLGRYRSNNLEQVILMWREHWPSSIQNIVSTLIERKMPRLPYQAIGITILLAYSLQFFNIFGSYMMARAMDIVVPLFEWAVIQAVVSIVQVFPISLGGLGVREGTIVLLLSLYSISSGQSIAYSLTGFLITAVLITSSWLTAEAIEHNT